MRRKREERRLCSTQTAIERQHKHKLDHSAWYSLLSQAATPLPSSPLPTLIKHHLLHNHRSLQQQQQQLDHDSVNRTTKVLLGVPDFPAYSDDDGSERLPLERLRQVDLGGVGWGLDRPAIGASLLQRAEARRAQEEVRQGVSTEENRWKRRSARRRLLHERTSVVGRNKSSSTAATVRSDENQPFEGEKHDLDKEENGETAPPLQPFSSSVPTHTPSPPSYVPPSQ